VAALRTQRDWEKMRPVFDSRYVAKTGTLQAQWARPSFAGPIFFSLEVVP